ncbi:MAG TPA: hypothetical protein VGF55_05520 [Gemmataceae bacterium]|jgi:hypothetical protein
MKRFWPVAVVLAWAAANPGLSADDARPRSLPDAMLQRTRPIFDGKTLDGWAQGPPDSWTVKDGAMASTGAEVTLPRVQY